MILWTVMPLELVFGQEDISNPYDEIDYDGTKLMVERVSINQCRVVRLLSSNPQDYLRDDIQPGAMLTYKPVLAN